MFEIILTPVQHSRKTCKKDFSLHVHITEVFIGIFFWISFKFPSTSLRANTFVFYGTNSAVSSDGYCCYKSQGSKTTFNKSPFLFGMALDAGNVVLWAILHCLDSNCFANCLNDPLFLSNILCSNSFWPPITTTDGKTYSKDFTLHVHVTWDVCTRKYCLRFLLNFPAQACVRIHLGIFSGSNSVVSYKTHILVTKIKSV